MINTLINRKKNSKIDKICDCDGNVVTSPQVIAEKFNYFANIAENLKSKIPQSMGDTNQFLGTKVNDSINLRRTNSIEVSQIIENLKVKATSDINVASIKKAEKAN